MDIDSFSIPKYILKRFKQARIKHNFLCNAPFVSISIGYDGQVSPCCYTLGHDNVIGSALLTQNSIKEIWQGLIFEKYRHFIKNNLLPPSCHLCKKQILDGVFQSVKILEFDNFDSNLKFPSIIELNIDNTCNLECVMCSSVNSSMIAKRNKVIVNELDNENIFQQLTDFLPHASEMIFSGGEPFLSKIYFRIWEKLMDVNPNCKITINTNATILNSKIKDILEKGKFNFNISLDSIYKETYEKIRVNAKFETFIENFKYLSEYSLKKNIPISTPICPLVYNYKEIPEIVEFCNKNNAYLIFVHVFGAHNVALNSASSDILNNALKFYKNIRLSNDTNVAKHNSLRFKEFVLEVNIWKEKAIKKEHFIQNLNHNSQNFSVKYFTLKNIIINYSTDEKHNDEIINKLDQVFNILPEYYKSEYFINLLIKLPLDVCLPIIIKFHPTEIAEYFRLIFNDNFNL